jgi:hypothetical protein
MIIPPSKQKRVDPLNIRVGAVTRNILLLGDMFGIQPLRVHVQANKVTNDGFGDIRPVVRVTDGPLLTFQE